MRERGGGLFLKKWKLLFFFSFVSLRFLSLSLTLTLLALVFLHDGCHIRFADGRDLVNGSSLEKVRGTEGVFVLTPFPKENF